MTTDYAYLTTFTLEPSELQLNYHSLPKVIHIEDAAISVMIDFASHPPLTFDETAPMVMARRSMESNHTHFILTLNAEQKITGFLSLKHILGEAPIKIMEKNRVTRSEILIRSVMTPLAVIPVIEMTKLELAKVGHIIATLEQLECECLFVVETGQENKKALRGVFLASTLNKLRGSVIQAHTD